jgi:hypothetical protein
MLTRDEKYTQCESYIKSDRFGLDTWMIIERLRINFSNMIATMELYQNMVKCDMHIQVKQHIMLDIIVKIMILIETTLVLVDALSTGYHMVVKKLTYYAFSDVYQIMENIRTNQYNYRKVLGFPSVDTLPLASEEQKYLAKNYQKRFTSFSTALNRLIGFYNKFRILYGKSKHGLTFVSGVMPGASVTSLVFEDSLLICYDRKGKQDMAHAQYIQTSFINTREKHFFNAISNVRFNQNLFDEIRSTITILKDDFSFVCKNNLTHAVNCGEGYLPYIVDNNKIGIQFSGKTVSEEEKNMRKSIAEKITPLINTREVNLKIEINYEKPEIIQSLANNSVTNLWINPGPSTCDVMFKPDVEMNLQAYKTQ